MLYYQRNLLILSLTIGLATLGWNQIVPFLPLFLKDLGVTKDLPFWSGVIFSIQGAATVFMGPFWGKVADKYGRKMMTIRAGICLVLIYFGMSLCKTFWQLAVLRVLNGVLTGFIPSSIALIATNTPKEFSGRYVSIAQTASAAGAIAGPAIGGLLAAATGYRNSMMVSGLIVAFAVLLVVIFVEEREKPAVEKTTSIWQDFGLAFTIPVLVFAMLADFTAAIASMAIQPILSLHLEKMLPETAEAVSGFMYSMPGLALLLTAYWWSRIGERYTYPKAILAGLIGTGLIGILLGSTKNIVSFGIIYFLMGVFMAALNSNTAALIATNIDSNFRGRAYGMQQAARNVGFFFAPLISGVVGSSLGMNYAFYTIGAFCLVITIGLSFQARTWSPSRENVIK